MEELKIENNCACQNRKGDGGQIVYAPYKKGIEVKKYRGIGNTVVIPEIIDEKPVISIDKKAFLSCKTIQEIILPDTVVEIGDWAFAHAENLRSVTIPRRDLSRGKELFLGCKRLKGIELNNLPDNLSGNGLERMLSLGVTVLHDYFLFSPMEVGSDDWVKRWDEKLIKLIDLDDLDGFEELWTCGEEDYEGKDYDIKSYPVEKRKMKLRIVYFRLQNPYKIAAATKDRLQEYLCASKEAWEIIVDEHKNELEYYKTFTAAGAATPENFDRILSDLDDAPAEIKAFMLRYKEENFEKKDVFGAFELDW
jgi:hypothetical protein